MKKDAKSWGWRTDREVDPLRNIYCRRLMAGLGAAVAIGLDGWGELIVKWTNTLPWPDNLWADINAGQDISSGEGKEQPETKDGHAAVLYYPNLEEVISTSLSERQQRILRMRYEQGKSYGEIAGKFGLGRERVRQIILGFLRTLRKPENYMRLNAVPELGVSELRKELDDLSRQHNELKQRFSELFGEREKKKAENRLQIPLSTPIYKLNFSTRSTNVLIKNGITTIGELIKCSPSDLEEFSYLGPAVLKNVIAVLSEYDFELKREDW